MPSTASHSPALHAKGITKRFPGVLAVDGVDFAVDAGEIVALLGQNGAGKSTLIQILAGVHAPGSYAGAITLTGAPYRPASVADAERCGVALVPQEIQVVPELSVAANLFLHAEPTRHGFVDHERQRAMARRALDEFGLDVDVLAPIGTLDLATQQLIIIVRALSKNARVLILDEPTAALTDNEAQRLFTKLRALRSRGVGIVFVSHRLAEVFSLSDRIVVMRDGRVCGDFPTAQATRDGVVRQMIGAAAETSGRMSTRKRAPESDGAPHRAALAVTGLVVHDTAPSARALVDGLDFDVGEGEIVGMFGLLGAGCNEAALAVYGAWPGPVAGDIRAFGAPASIRRPADAISHGIGLMAQDRRDGLLPEHSILDNTLLASLRLFSRCGRVEWQRVRVRVSELARRLSIKAPSIDVPVAALSGGNQQKVQIARWLASAVKILLLVDPTRGVDVGSRAEITRVWRELAARGYALLLVSSDAEELVDVCDRVLVLRNGRQAAEFAAGGLTEAALLRAAAGI